MSIEQIADALSGLYESYGYSPYTMSKFEEYELYLHNKDFLVSDRVLTFTDTDGRLMALKPDVTLSIIKNRANSYDQVQKVYYRENVYRPGKNDQGFKEIMQVGLECMGAVDTYCILEVLLLAIKSLQTISSNCVLDISHMGLVSCLLDQSGLTGNARKQVLEAIGNKNVHEIRSICRNADVCSEKLETLVQISGKPAMVLPELDTLFEDTPDLLQLKQLLTALDKCGVDCINVDFSVVNDMNYYNGIVFRGFIEGVPEGVLSGGQYDGLMKKMKRNGRAIGFALYPDLLERLICQKPEVVDTVLYYDETADIATIAAAIDDFASKGIRIVAQRGEPEKNHGKCYRVVNNEVFYLEALRVKK